MRLVTVDHHQMASMADDINLPIGSSEHIAETIGFVIDEARCLHLTALHAVGKKFTIGAYRQHATVRRQEVYARNAASMDIPGATTTSRLCKSLKDGGVKEVTIIIARVKV